MGWLQAGTADLGLHKTQGMLPSARTVFSFKDKNIVIS